jgi:hypothetical protein
MMTVILTLALKLFALFVLVPLATGFAMMAWQMSRMTDQEIREEFGPKESQIEFRKAFPRGWPIR